MANNAEKTFLGRTLSAFAEGKVQDGIQLQGKAFPVSIVTVNNWSVIVKFEVNAAPFTLPNIEVPLSNSLYERPPLQIGDKGWVRPADARLGGVSGLGSGTADLSLPANLAALVFEPISNTNWDAPPDKNAYLIQGPNGFILRDIGNDYSIIGNDTNITIKYGSTTFVVDSDTISATASGNSIVVNPSGVAITGTLTINGAPYLAHMHSGVQSGGSDTGPVV